MNDFGGDRVETDRELAAEARECQRCGKKLAGAARYLTPGGTVVCVPCWIEIDSRESVSSGMVEGTLREEKPSADQIGGEHYKNMPIQPSEFIYRNRIPWPEGNVIKYVCRHKFKNGAEDIRKAIHYLELLLEWEYPKSS